MADVVVTPVASWRDRRAFFRFPWQLYRDDPHWIPPLRRNLKELLGWRRHPFHKIADMQTFVARRGGAVCGRIAAIVNHEHNRVHGEKRGFFGFFECVDDQQVADALFDAAWAWLAERGMTALRGPANPSMNYECGLLIDGFDSHPTFMMTYNPPYYARLVEGYGFRKAHDLYAYIGYVEQLPDAQKRLDPTVAMAKERLGARIRPLDKSRFLADVKLFLEMYNRACSTMWGFVPLTEREVRKLAGSLKHLLVPQLSLAGEAEGKTAGVVLGLPDYNPTIKQIDGRLFPFGFLKLLRNKRSVKRLRIISIAVVPEYQRWGLGLVLMRGMTPNALALGITEAEFSWVVESNTMARSGLEKAGAKIYKTYRMYDYEPGG